MMECNLLFSYEKKINILKIKRYLNDIDEPKQVITNNLDFHQVLKKNNINSKIIGELIPDDGIIAEEIYQKTKTLHKEYENAFKKLRFKEISIFGGFSNLLFRQIMFLFKTEKVLENKKNTVFIFKDYLPVFFLIKRKAKEMGYNSTKTIEVIEKNEIKTLDNSSFKKYEKKVSEKRAFNFLRNSFGREYSLDNMKTLSIVSIELTKLIIKKISYKISNKITVNTKDSILKKIEKKNIMSKNLEILFFVTTGRGDLYLDPWKPIIKLLENSSIPFQVYTNDIATSSILSNDKISFYNLFSDVKMLEKEIIKMQIWNEIKMESEKIIQNNESIFGIEDFSDYFIKQIQRTVAISLIIDVICKTHNIKSIVAIADGEMLENISVEFAKKNKIKSYSLLPVYVSPQPFLKEWFKVDKIFVHGADGFDALKKLNYNKEKMIITGNPKYDFLQNIKMQNSKNILKKELNVDMDKPLIVIAMSRWHDGDIEWMSKFIKFCNENNFEIIIKIHPIYKSNTRKYSDENIKRISEQCSSKNYKITYETETTSLLSAAKLVITDFSNVGIEAILLDKPVLTINFSNDSFKHVLRYHEYNSSIYLETYSDLENIVKEIIIENKHLKYLEEGREKIIDMVNYKNDGNAAERIFNTIEK